jgi:two-component system chemotaxis response regulator CheY
MTILKGRVLCTEDHEDTRDLIVFVLTQAGFETECSDNAEAAIELAKSKQFDLYLIDSWLPDVSGIGLCEALRKFDEKTPILFYSGAGFERDKEHARLVGAQGYLVKPVDGDRLAAEVSRLIEESKTAYSVQSSSPSSV